MSASAAAPALNPPRSWRDDPLFAFVGPFVIFMLGLMLVSFVKAKEGSLWLTHPEYWPIRSRPSRARSRSGLVAKLFVSPAGCPRDRSGSGDGDHRLRPLVLDLTAYLQPLLDFVLSPFLAPAVREGGFDPTLLASNPPLYYATLGFRMARLVIVVPLIDSLLGFHRRGGEISCTN